MRWFASWNDFFEFLVLLTIGVDGVCQAPWLWVVIGAMLLFLLRWPRWSELIRNAGEVDANYRDLGRRALARRLYRLSVLMYSKARLVPLVLGASFLEDALFLAGAYVVGMAIAWFWGVDVGTDPFTVNPS